MSKRILEMAAGLVQAQALKGPMSTDEIVASLTNVFGALMSLRKSETDGRASNDGALVEAVIQRDPSPAKIDPKDSIQDDKVICLECGASMLQLTHKHLHHHGLSFQEYKTKWGFPAKQPLSSKNVSKARSRMAKKRGLSENLIRVMETKRMEKERLQSPTVPLKSVEPSLTEQKNSSRKRKVR
jgi:predicted transcriptional regulator